MSWNAVAGASHYYLYLLDDTTGQAVINNANVSSASFLVTTALKHGHSYTWYVAAESTNNADVVWSGPDSFTLAS